MARTAAPAPTTEARAVGRDESWPLRSITKSFTVTLILQLADEGLSISTTRWPPRWTACRTASE
jgi:CubicO group peptidase (beta-lactamase class C family)